MLYAKLNPPAKKYNSPFSTEFVNVEYLTAMVRPYATGALNFNIEIIFGNIDNQTFTRIFSQNITMTNTELSSWGTDDSILLSLIATKLGSSTTEFITIN